MFTAFYDTIMCLVTDSLAYELMEVGTCWQGKILAVERNVLNSLGYTGKKWYKLKNNENVSYLKWMKIFNTEIEAGWSILFSV